MLLAEKKFAAANVVQNAIAAKAAQVLRRIGARKIYHDRPSAALVAVFASDPIYFMFVSINFLLVRSAVS